MLRLRDQTVCFWTKENKTNDNCKLCLQTGQFILDDKEYLEPLRAFLLDFGKE